jgi:hypothetical protein
MKSDTRNGHSPVLDREGNFIPHPREGYILCSMDVLAEINGAPVTCVYADEERGEAEVVIQDSHGNPVPDGKGGILTARVWGDVRLVVPD